MTLATAGAGLNESDSNLTNESELSCFKATQDEAFYVKIVWTAAAEFPGTALPAAMHSTPVACL